MFRQIFVLRATYLKKWNDVLTNRSYLHLDGFDTYITVVITNEEDDAVLIFPQDVISEITQSGPTEISAYISIVRGNAVLYKFGFSNASQASAWKELLLRLSRPLRTTSTRAYRRPYRDSAVEEFFRGIEREIELRQLIIDHDQRRLNSRSAER